MDSVTPAQPCDLDLNPRILVSDIDVQPSDCQASRLLPSHITFLRWMSLSFVNHKFVGQVKDQDAMYTSIRGLLSCDLKRIREAMFFLTFIHWVGCLMADALIDRHLFQLLGAWVEGKTELNPVAGSMAADLSSILDL